VGWILGMKKKPSSITIYFSKSQLEKKLNISRKTIQRKVTEGKLSQNEKGHVRWDELVALLETEQVRGRRGPKWSKPKKEPAASAPPPYDPIRGFGKASSSPNESTAWNQRVDHQAVAVIKRLMADLGSASLDVIAKEALILSSHKSRLARVDLIKPGAEILAALQIPPPRAARKRKNAGQMLLMKGSAA
jgi:hypothetical protein